MVALGSRRGRMLGGLVGAALVAGLLGPASAAASADEPALRFVGLLPRSPWDPVGASTGIDVHVVAMDAARGLLYALYLRPDEASWHLLTYSLRTGVVPTPVKDIQVPIGELPTTGFPVSPRYSVRDTRRNRLLIAFEATYGDMRIVGLDLESGRVVSRWRLAEELPGLKVQGITYSPQDDRVYVAGEMIASFVAENYYGYRPQVVAGVLALEAESGKRAWALPLPACQQPLNTYLVGVLVARSIKSQALYIPCAQTDAAPRASGIAKIFLGPKGGSADQSEALDFQTEFFPISGRYKLERPFAGIHASTEYDPQSDRIFLQSLSQFTPGAWVFDGRMSGWVGFIAAPLPLQYIAVNGRTGHFYAASSTGKFLVTNGRGTPAPQGSVFDYHATTYMVADEGSRRVFVKWERAHAGSRAPLFGDDDLRWVVLEDNTSDEPPLEPIDYDELTHDIPESDQTESTYAGGITGYGSRVYWVGGWSGLLRSSGSVISPAETVRDLGTPSEVGGIALGGFGINDLGFHPRDRGVMMARVASLDIRSAGSSASAQSVAPDSATGDEWENRRATTEGSCHKATTRMGLPDAQCEGQPDETLASVAGKMPAWPWAATTCLDGGESDDDSGDGSDDEESNPLDEAGGHTIASCSLSDQRSTATSSFGRVELTTGAGAPSLEIASSYLDAETRREKDRGTVSHAFASAHGIRIRTAAGSVSIADASQEVTAIAHGRPGTAKVATSRRLSGIVIQPQGGEAEYVAECENQNCQDVLMRINHTLGEAIRIEMPKAEATSTEKGAFAGFQKQPGQYFHDLTTQNDDTKAAPALQVILYSDSEEKSRVVLQLAAIEATAIYTISPAAEFDFDDPRPDEFSGDDQSADPLSDSVVDGERLSGGSNGPGMIPGGFPGVVKGVTAFLIRSPLQALQLASILLLILGAVASLVRRRSIMAFLDEGGNLS